MIAEQITNIKTFMSHLLIKDSFDGFDVMNVSITTYNTFTIDGHVHKSFYSPDEYETITEKEISSWKTLKPFCYQIIKGHNTPLKFKIVFKMPEDITESIAEASQMPLSDIEGLYLNVVYENGNLTCITGTSLNIFDMSKDTEKAFDKYVSSFVSTLSC